MSDDSDIRNKAATSSESSDNARPLLSNKRRRKQLETSSDSEDSEIEFNYNLRRKKKLVQIPSSEDDSSDSGSEEIVVSYRRRPPQPLKLSDYESGNSSGEGNDSQSSSDSETEKNASTNKVDGSLSESSDADDQTERCPICLVKFKTQEIGSLETCDHCFCVPCIQEWAKNVPTCPVDRQQFSLILVRQNLEGSVVRRIPISPPTVTPVAIEDATACEVCGQSDREDRMLLCDWCDHGYHMECLNPPLEYVPIDEWYCPECAPTLQVARFTRHLDQNVEDHSEEDENILPYRPARRMLPRTRQSERVRSSLGHTRRQGNVQQRSTSSGVESMESETKPKPRQRMTHRKIKRKPRFRIKKIVTDEGVIEVLLKTKSKKKWKKKHKKRTLRATPRTVKGRLASKLGICAPRVTEQMIPETLNRQNLMNAPMNHQRHQAGIPTLDLFGRRDQLDYFSGSDGEDEMASQEGGVGIMSRTRVARPSDRHLNIKRAASILNSTVDRKPMKIEPIAPTSGSLLDSILDSQTLWHSKRAEIKTKSDGSLQVVLPRSSNSITVKEENKIDVRKATAPVIQTPMYPSGKSNSATYNPGNSNRGGQTHSGGRGGMEQSYDGRNATSAGSGMNSLSAPSPLRGIAPIRFRMNLPPRRPNIHSYPTDNIPPPPPARLRSPLVEVSFPVTNSPESSPPRDDDEIDIYSDIEQDNTANNEGEEKSFGTLEPPPEPPFLMTMEPPPEPPALLMTLNDDPSDDEATGLVIADEPTGDAYDPCAANSDDSSNDDRPLTKPPGVPIGLGNPELVANYSSDSATEASSYNPELPTYQGTPIIGPLPRPPSHNSSEAEDNDEECPNFSMYSAASMSLAHRGKPAPVMDLDIPIPPPVKEKDDLTDSNIPLPDTPKSNKDENSLDIPIPTNDRIKSPDHSDQMSDSSENQKDVDKKTNIDKCDKSEVDMERNVKRRNLSDNELDEDDDPDDEEDDDDDEEEEEEEDGKENNGSENCVNDGNESDCNNSVEGEEQDKSVKSVVSKVKGFSETADDECSTQGDVLDLAIEPESNLDNNVHHDETEEQIGKCLAKCSIDEEVDRNVDGGDKSDGLVDITDEEMSVYDCQDNVDDIGKLDDPTLESAENNQNCDKSLYSDDDNSLVGGATSAVSGGTLNNSDNVQPPTLPGLEGLETETISESEDVNFDELPLEGSELPETVIDEEEHSSTRKKKKKKNRKTSHTDEDGGPKCNNEPLEFEEGEIVEDKPKQLAKKDKKIKSKPENNVVKGDENNSNKPNVPEKEATEKKSKKKKDKSAAAKDKNDKHKEIKEKTLKPGQADENISWKKLSKSTKDRNYRDGKEKDDKDLENKDEGTSKKDKRSREKRKELERYNVRRLISEKPKRPKKDEFGRDISPSKSGSSLSPYRPPRYRSPLRTRNRSRTRSRSWKSRSRSRGRRRRSRSRDRVRSRDRSRKARSRDRSRRSRSKNKVSSRSRDRRRTRTPEREDRVRNNRSLSKSRRRSRTPSFYSRRYHSYSRSWSPSWSRSSISRSRSPRIRRRSRSNHSRSKSKSWTREQNITSVRRKRPKDPPKNLTVIVTNKEALKKKEKKKISKKKDELRKKKYNQSPAPSKEVFTSGDNILVSVNFKNANKTPELIPASTPLLRESSKRKRDDGDTSVKKKKSTSSKKTPGAKKSNRLAKINEAARNAKPVAIIDLDLSPFREVDLSPKEVIVLSDSGDEGEKKRPEMQDEMDQLSHSGINQSMLSLVSNDHKQKTAMSQPESPLSTSFILNSSGPKTPPEPHIKFSISTKPSQVRMLSNPLMEADEELHDDENIEDVNEILHKGPNTPPEPPPDLNTPASPPTTPYDPFDPTKSRSPSPQPRGSDVSSQHNTSREEKLDNIQNENDESTHLLAEPKISSPVKEFEDLKKTPEPAKVHSTPKSDPIFPDLSPKMSPTAGLSETNKLPEDSLMKPIQKILANANKLDVAVHKSPEKLVTVVISQQQVKSANQTPKQTVQPLKPITPNKHQTPKGNTKHQLFSSSLMKQVPILGALSLLPGPPVYSNVGLNSASKITSGRTQQNGDHFDDMDIDPSSPYSPGSSEGDDLFEPPMATPPRASSKPITKAKPTSSNKFDSLFGSSPAKPRHGKHLSKTPKKGMKPKSKGSKKEEIKVKLDEDQLKILDELPSSAVEMQVKDKFLKKLNRQERVVEEVKLVLKPHYAKKHVTKEEYKEILRRAVPKICHNKSGEINPIKIQFLIEAYVKKFRYAKKKASGALPASTQNKPKTQKALWS